MQNSNKVAFIGDDQEPQINDDLSQLVSVKTQSMSWSESPMPGVQRKRLELIGTEHPQLTTLVKFAPGSYFEQHEHDGGEEFLVIDGIFSDASGDFGKGFYVRNPPGTAHKPFTESGCTILVKLRQFNKNDGTQLAIDTHNNLWRDSSQKGIKKCLLHHYKEEQVFMYQLNNGCDVLQLKPMQLCEIYVIEGEIAMLNATFATGSWIRSPANTSLKLSSKNGAKLWIKFRVINK